MGSGGSNQGGLFQPSFVFFSFFLLSKTIEKKGGVVNPPVLLNKAVWLNPSSNQNGFHLRFKEGFKGGGRGREEGLKGGLI